MYQGVCVPVCPCISVSMHQSMCQCISVSMHQCVRVSMCPCICSVYMFISASVRPCISVSVYQYVCVSVCLCISVSVYPYICVSLYMCIVVVYPLPLTLVCGRSPIIPLLVQQSAYPSIWPAAQSLQRGLSSTNPGVTMWCVCECS